MSVSSIETMGMKAAERARHGAGQEHGTGGGNTLSWYTGT